MTNDEFKELKARLVERAKQVIIRLGSSMAGTDGPIHHFRRGDCAVVQHEGQLFVMTPSKNYLTNSVRFSKVYEERGGVEVPMGLSHFELVRQYQLALQELDRALILEDLADV